MTLLTGGNFRKLEETNVTLNINWLNVSKYFLNINWLNVSNLIGIRIQVPTGKKFLSAVLIPFSQNWAVPGT